MITTCTTCGQIIKNIVVIDGKPYGTTCAGRLEGVSFPVGFTGNYDNYRKNYARNTARKAASVADMQSKAKAQAEFRANYLDQNKSIISRIKVVLSRKYNLTQFEIDFCRDILNYIEAFNPELSEKQLVTFAKIEAPIIATIANTENQNRTKFLASKFTELIPLAKENKWNATQLREYISLNY